MLTRHGLNYPLQTRVYRTVSAQGDMFCRVALRGYGFVPESNGPEHRTDAVCGGHIRRQSRGLDTGRRTKLGV